MSLPYITPVGAHAFSHAQASLSFCRPSALVIYANRGKGNSEVIRQPPNHWDSDSCHAFKISRLDSTRSIKGRIPNLLEMANDSSGRVMAFSRSPGSFRWRRVPA